MSDKRSFLNAVAWSFSSTWGDRAFSALVAVLLAAFLGPRDFGIITIALVYVGFIGMILEQGLGTALIQKADLEPQDLNVVFWVNLLMSLSLAGLSILFSSWWAQVNHLPGLPVIIAALSLGLPIQGMTIVQLALLQRGLDFKSLSIRSNIAVLAGGIVGIGMAIAGFGIWSLVGQQLVKALVALVLLWRVSAWRPGFELSWRHLKVLLGFSLPTFVARLGIFADTQAGVILLGAFFGPVAAGLYRLAERFTSTATAATAGAIQTASLPEFSRHQLNPTELRKSVLTCIRMSSTMTLPVLTGLASVSDSLMATLGPQWLPAANVAKVLSVLGMILSFTMYTGALLQAVGRPRSVAVIEWTRTGVGVICLAGAGYWARGGSDSVQIIAVALARLTSGVFLVTPVFLYILMRIAGISIRQLATAITPSLIASASIAGSVLLFRSMISGASVAPFVLLMEEIVVGGVCGVAALLIVDSQLRLAVGRRLRGAPMLRPLFNEAVYK
jgi:PST family polysaccharide transporter